MKLFFVRQVTVLCWCISMSVLAVAQWLPSERLTDWSSVTLPLSFEPDVVIDFVAEGGDSTGNTPNDALLQELLERYPNEKVLVSFSEGVYLFKQTISLPSNHLLQGAAANNTHFKFDLSGNGHLIQIEGAATDTLALVSQPIVRSDSFLLATGAAQYFDSGDVLQLADEDADRVTSSWAQGATGQICEVHRVHNDTLWLRQPIRRAYLLSDMPYVRKIRPITNVGIEQLRIERLDSTGMQTSHVLMRYATRCWLRCVESYRCNFSHVDVRYSRDIWVSGSHFQDAFDYGNGGKGYGVTLHFATSDCHITNNSFDHLRHAILLQAGANGNVISYNFSQNPYWTDVFLPSNSAGDLVLHGNYPYANLLEGNVVQNIVIDDSHGINGPHNTFFRNRAEGYGIFMNNTPPSDGQNFIGNEITNDNLFLGLYHLEGNDHFEYGNHVRNDTIPASTIDNIPASLYLSSIPDGWGTTPFPAIGFPRMLAAHTIPAQKRAIQDELTACASMLSSIISVPTRTDNTAVHIYPNPTQMNDQIYIQTSAGASIRKLALYSIAGRLCWEGAYTASFSVRPFERGVYLVHITLSDGSSYTKKLLHF